MRTRQALSRLASLAALGALVAVTAASSSGHTPGIASHLDCESVPTVGPDIMALPVRPKPTAGAIAYQSRSGLAIKDQPADALPFIERVRTVRGFAGVWWDSDTATYNIAAQADEMEALIERIDPSLPRGVTVYFHPVAYSYAELERMTNTIFADRDAWLCQGIAINEFSVSETRNVIELGVHPFTSNVMDAISARYVGPLEFSDSPPGGARLN